MVYDWLSLSPHLVLAGAALLLIGVDVVWHKAADVIAPYFTAFAGLAAAAAAWRLWGVSTASWSGALVTDQTFVVFSLIFAATLFLVALLSTKYGPLGNLHRPEYFALLLLVTCAVNFMASAANLVLLYVAIEFSSIISYVLVGYIRGDKLSSEAGLKYFLYGASASAIMLLGFVMLYGMSGTTDLNVLAGQLPRMTRMYETWGHAAVMAGGAAALTQSPSFLFVSLALIVVGLGYKVAAVPFHMWAPDAYHGAPTPVAAFLSVASKASGFAVILRLVAVFHPTLDLVYGEWMKTLGALAVASMLFGVVVGSVQKDVRRILAYSSIAHAGFVLLGFAADSVAGYASILVYLIIYVAMNVGAFGAVAVIGHVTGSFDLSSYAGLARRHPFLAALLSIFMLSLAGIPPLAGFFAKFYILAALIDGGQIFLAIVAIGASVVALYLYARVFKAMYFEEGEAVATRRVVPAAAVSLALCLALTVALGVWPHPIITFVRFAAGQLFPRI